MENLITHIAIGLSTFAVTNIDDLLILSIYFANPAFKKSNVITGQYIGVLALVTISLSGLVLGKVMEPRWIGLLGLIPVLIGIKGLISLFRKEADEESAIIESKSKIQFLNVALITMANGGDNIGVYTPIFASTSPMIVAVYILVFILMIALWCLFAFYLVKHPVVKNAFAKYGHIILPFFLIALGIWIIIESLTPGS